MSHRHLYLRDYSKPNKQPIGCVAVEVDRTTNEIRYAVSVCSPFDSFKSKLARDKASGRLVQSPVIINIEVPQSAHAITKLIMEHIMRSNSVQSKERSRSYLALQAARGWLDNIPKQQEA